MNKTLEFTSDPIFIYKIYEAVPQNLKLEWLEFIFSYLESYTSHLPIDFKYISQYVITDSQSQNFNDTLGLTDILIDLIHDIKSEPTESHHAIKLIKTLNKLFQYLNDSELVVIHYIESALTMFYYEDQLKNHLKTKEDILKFKIIDEIFWNDWDPLNLNGSSARHEYYRYIPEVIQIMNHNLSVENLYSHFEKIYKYQFELEIDTIKINRIVSKLIDLK